MTNNYETLPEYLARTGITDDDELIFTIGLSDYIRHETLRRTVETDGYKDLTLTEKNALYDQHKTDVMRHIRATVVKAIDDVAYDQDPFEYQDIFDTREAGRRSVSRDLDRAQTREDILYWLQYTIGADPETAAKAEEIIRIIHYLYD